MLQVALVKSIQSGKHTASMEELEMWSSLQRSCPWLHTWKSEPTQTRLYQNQTSLQNPASLWFQYTYYCQQRVLEKHVGLLIWSCVGTVCLYTPVVSLKDTVVAGTFTNQTITCQSTESINSGVVFTESLVLHKLASSTQSWVSGILLK